MADGKVEIEVILDDKGVKAQVKKLDSDLAKVGKTMPKTFDKGAAGVEQRSKVMRGNVKNVLAMSENDAKLAGTNFSKNLATPIGKTSESIVKQFKATGQGISAPLITASYAGSTAFKNMATKGDSAFSRFTSAAKKQISGLGGQLQTLGPTMINVSDRIGTSVKRGIQAPFKGAIGLVKQYGALVGIMGAGAMVKAGLDRLSAIEDARISLKVMMGDAQKADKFMDDVLAFAKTTPFAFPQLATASKNMVAFGMDAEKVIPTMQAIGNAAAASGKGAEGLDMISAAFGDLQLSGRVSMDQMNRLTANGVNALTILANHYGVSVDDMRKKISKGAVNSQEAIDILVHGIENGTKGVAGETAKMGGLMEEMKDSWRGSIDSMKSAISSTMATILKPAIPHIREFMKWFGDEFKKLPDFVNRAIEVIKPIFEQLLPVFKNVASAVKDKIIPAIVDMAPMITPIIVAVLGAFKLLGDFIVNVIAPAFQNFGKFVQEHTTLMQALTVGIVAVVGSLWAIGAVMPIVLNLMTAFKAFKEAKTILLGVRGAMVALNMSFLANPVVLIITAIVAAIAIAAFLIIKYWDEIKAAFFVAWEAVKNFGIAIWDGLKATWKAVANFAIKVWDGIVAFFKTLWNSVKDVFKLYWDIMKNNVKAVIDTIKTVIKTGFEMVKTIIAAVFLTIVYLVTGQWDKIGAVWKAAGAKIVSLVTSMVSSIKAIWSKWVSNLVSIIVTFASTMYSKFTTVKSNVTNTVSSLITSVVKFFSELPSKVATALVKLISTVKEKWTKLKTDAVQVGTDMILGLIKGIGSMGKAVASKVTEVVGGAINAAKKFLGIASPSKVAAQLGKFTGQGFANGVKGTAKQVAAAAKKTANEAIKNLELKYDTKKISTQTYINELKKLQNQFKLTGDQARKVQKEIYDAQQKINKESKINNEKKANEAIKNLEVKYDTGKLDPKQYIAALKKIQSQYKLTGDQVRKVQKEISNANAAIKKQAEEQAKSIKKINDGVKAANDKYLEKVKQINSKLQSDIKKVKDDYTKSLKDLANSIYSQTGLFDEVKVEAINADDLLKNLGDQNMQFERWQENLNRLSSNGASKEFIEELRAMGVGAANEIEAIANMPKDKLKDYVNAWSEKHKLAEAEATKQMAKEKEAMEKQVKSLTEAANKELTKAKTEWTNNVKKLSDEIKKLGTFKDSGKVLGKNTMQGLINGLKSMKGPLEKEVNSLAKTIEKEVKKALKIKSPSRLMEDEVGAMVPAGIVEGIDGGKRDLINKTKDMSKWLMGVKGMQAPVEIILPKSVIMESNDNGGKNNKKGDTNKTEHTIIVPVNIDGREVAKATVDPLTKMQKRNTKRARRKPRPNIGGALT